MVFLIGLSTVTNAQNEKANKKATKEQARSDKEDENQARFEELLVNWETPPRTGDVDIDLFHMNCSLFMDEAKKQKEDYDRLKFDVSEKGGTKTVKVTNRKTGAPLKKASVNRQLTDINTNYLAIAATSVTTLASGTNLLYSLTRDPIKALKMAKDIRGLKKSINAIKLGSTEVPKMAQTAKEKRELINTAKYIE